MKERESEREREKERQRDSDIEKEMNEEREVVKQSVLSRFELTARIKKNILWVDRLTFCVRHVECKVEKWHV